MAALDRNYDSAEYNITRDQQFDRAAITASTIAIAMFVARARMYVTNVIVGVRSAASIAALVGVVQHHTAQNVAGSLTTKSCTFASATSAGSMLTIALNRTLAAGEALSVIFNDAKGKVHVLYEYQILPV